MLRGSKINKKKEKGQDKAFGRPISEELFLPLKAFQGCCTFQPVGIHVNEVLQKSSAQFHFNESSQPLAQWRQGERPDFRMNSEGGGGDFLILTAEGLAPAQAMDTNVRGQDGCCGQDLTAMLNKQHLRLLSNTLSDPPTATGPNDHSCLSAVYQLEQGVCPLWAFYLATTREPT